MAISSTNSDASANSAGSDKSTKTSSANKIISAATRTKLQEHISELRKMARQAFGREFDQEPLVSYTHTKFKYLNLQACVNAFFNKNSNTDWYIAGAYHEIIELKTLVCLVGNGLGMMPTKAEWPVMEVGEKEEAIVQKRVYRMVDGKVFGRERSKALWESWVAHVAVEIQPNYPQKTCG
jgi:hypothetical protein